MGQVQLDLDRVPLGVRHGENLGHAHRHLLMIDVQFGGDHQALLQPGTQAGGDIDINLKIFHVREGQQGLARLGGIADLHGFLDDDAVEGRDAPGVTQLGIQGLQIGL